jgi:hypothetical protein
MSAMPSELVRVLSTWSIMEGEIAKARLEGEGIPVLLKGGGLDPYTTGVAYVFVPAEFEAQARLLLEDVVDEQPEGSESTLAPIRPRGEVSASSTGEPCGPS